jgi:hypothetical protein
MFWRQKGAPNPKPASRIARASEEWTDHLPGWAGIFPGFSLLEHTDEETPVVVPLYSIH